MSIYGQRARVPGSIIIDGKFLLQIQDSHFHLHFNACLSNSLATSCVVLSLRRRLWLLQVWLEQVSLSIRPLCYFFGRSVLCFSNIYIDTFQNINAVLVPKYIWQLRKFYVQEFGNIESPMYSRLRHFFVTIYNRSASFYIYFLSIEAIT